MSDITIKEASKEVTAWSKDITFEREGKTYSVTLNWDSYDGYDITFKGGNETTPNWAARWIEEGEYSESLLCVLDNLTEEKESE
jgi:hypothetical protein